MKLKYRLFGVRSQVYLRTSQPLNAELRLDVQDFRVRAKVEVIIIISWETE